MIKIGHAGAILSIDLKAISKNYKLLKSLITTSCECSAVVKSDAYGLGLAGIAKELAEAGCNSFFVAQIEEGVKLREILSPEFFGARIYLLNGLPSCTKGELETHRLIPVLNSLEEIATWSDYAKCKNQKQPAIINIDTGMSRLGLSPKEITILSRDHDCLNNLDIHYSMTHLACGDERGNPQNFEQKHRFDMFRNKLPLLKGCMANSAGIFLGSDYHYSMVRPGAAIYGIKPTQGEPNPMQPVVKLQGRILQIRVIKKNTPVGYGTSYRAKKTTKIATVAVGYGDGFLRNLGNRGSGFIGNIRVPIVGRVSMDLTTFDVTNVPESIVKPGKMVDLICPLHTLDDLAEEAGTIGYEILTNLGSRYFRQYVH